MSVSLEKIDMLMERANISYKEAKDALERFNGDMVEALIYLESNEKTAPKMGPANDNRHHHQRRHENRYEQRQRRQDNARDFGEDLKKFFKKVHETRFIIGRKGRKAVDIPMTIAALMIILTLPVSIFLLILPYLFGYQILILNPNGKKMTFDQFRSSETPHEPTQPQEDKPSEDRMA